MTTVRQPPAEQAAAVPSAGWVSVPERMPPGPPLPRALQTLGFLFAGPRFLDACRRRYGDAVTLGTLFDSRFVMVFDPDLVKTVFQGSNAQLHAGEANGLLGPVVGDRSVLLLDGAEHLRHRRLLLPPFHGRRMRLYEDVISRAADAEIDRWPVDEPFAALPSMQSLTLHVILQAVFGYEPGEAEAELARRLRAFIDPLAHPRRLAMLGRMILGRVRGDEMLERFAATRRAVDELLLAEIARRHALGDRALGEREDVFSALLLAEDEDGERLSDEEVRDELLTLLLAGHETTATGLAWALDLVLHDQEVLTRARDGDDDYLDAVAKESLRLRPVIAGVGRVVRGGPFRLGQWVIPEGVEINPSIRMIHGRADLYPDPAAFRPERFLGEGIDGAGVPDTYTWVPFGGGTRRCLGASFAMMEMRVVLRRILQRAGGLRAASPDLEQAEFRAITLAPRHGTMVVLDDRALA